MFVRDRSGYSFPSQNHRGVEQELDPQVRHIQECFAKLARQPAEKVQATCQLLGKIAPQKNGLQNIQDSLLKDLASSKKQLKVTQDKLEKLVERMRELDLQLPKAQENYEGEGNGAKLFRGTVCVLGSATALAFANYGLGRLVGIGLAVTAISAAFWALTASGSSTSKKQATQLETEAASHKQNIETARQEENQLKGRINEIVLGVQDAAARANVKVTQPVQREEVPATEPIAYAPEDTEERPRYRPSQHDRRYNDRRASARSEEDDEERQQGIDFFYNLLRMQHAQRNQQHTQPDQQDPDSDSDAGEPNEDFNLWNEDD